MYDLGWGNLFLICTPFCIIYLIVKAIIDHFKNKK